MYGNPSSTGMGQGAAQVFDASGIVNTYIKTAMMEQQQRQLEQQQVAKMLAQFDPSKLRPQDIPTFNKKYEELKNLYISNKGLYTNPMKNPTAYRRATELVSELNLQAQESKAYQEFGSSVGKQAIKNRNKLAPNFMEKFSVWNNLSTDQIKELNGGRIPDFTDVEFTPEEPNPTEMKALVKSAAQSIGALKTNMSFIGHDQDPTIPELSRREISEEVIDPGAMPSIANAILAKPSEQQRYEYMWENMPQQEKNRLRLDAVSAFPEVANRMSGSQLVATMDLYRNYRVLNRKEEVGTNDEAKEALAEQRRREDRSFQISMQNRREKFAKTMQENQNKADADKQNMNLTQTRQMLTNLVDGAKAGDKSKVDQAIAPLYQLAAGMESGIEVLYPKDYNTPEAFAAAIAAKKEAKEDGGTPPKTMSFLDIDADRAKKLHKDGVPVIYMKTLPSEQDQSQRVFFIDPTKEHMDAGIQSIVRMVGANSTGFAWGFDGYVQPKSGKKK